MCVIVRFSVWFQQKMSYGSLGRRSGLSYNPRLSTGSGSKSSNRLSLVSTSPISRSLTSLPFGNNSPIDQFMASAASSTYNTSSYNSHRRNPHGRRTSQTPSSIASRLRSSSQNSLNSIGSQMYSVMLIFGNNLI